MVLPFEKEYREEYYKLLDQVFDSNFWSDGKVTQLFEEKISENDRFVFLCSDKRRCRFIVNI